MKYKLLLVISLLSFSSSCYSQCSNWEGNYDLKFDDSSNFCHLIIDTVSDTTNIWHVGKPQKSVFNSAYSPLHAIVTDTVNPYPINDTSYFTIKNTVNYGGFIVPHTASVSGMYYVNSDTLTDYGKIEFSPDNGISWIDLTNDTTYSSYIHWSMSIKPVLSGNSNGWKPFAFNIAALGPILGMHIDDTILYKFTFISDSVQTNKDGLMFDQFEFMDYFESVEKVNNDDLIAIFPVPASNRIFIDNRSGYKMNRVRIVNTIGAIVYENNQFMNDPIDIKSLNSGMYYLHLSGDNGHIVKRFTVLR